MSPLVLGIDGGGTRSRAAVFGPGMEELGRAEGGAALVEGGESGVAAAVVTLRQLARSAIEAAGQDPPVSALHAALAGVGREPTRARLERALSLAVGPDAAPGEALALGVSVGTDVEAAFRTAFDSGPGLLVISGTGSIAWGRAEDGRVARVGGWGRLLGDEGSGYRVGLDALQAAARSRDGREEGTELEAAVFRALDLETPAELVDWVSAATKREIAELAPTVAATARRGDAVAGRILDEAALELARHAQVLVEKLGPWSEEPGLALSGGMLAPDGILRARVIAAVAECPCRPLDIPIDAVRGAALLALESIAAPTPEP